MGRPTKVRWINDSLHGHVMQLGIMPVKVSQLVKKHVRNSVDTSLSTSSSNSVNIGILQVVQHNGMNIQLFVEVQFGTRRGKMLKQHKNARISVIKIIAV